MRIARSLAVLATGTAAVFALLPAAGAQAAHSIGGYAVQCVNIPQRPSGESGIQVAVDGLGSDHPRNALMAARARVSANSACGATTAATVVRIQIDKVALIRYGKGVVTSAGPRVGGRTITLDTPGRAGACAQYYVGVRFSVRFAAGDLGHGNINGPLFAGTGTC